MNDIAPSHVFKVTHGFFVHKRFTVQITEWLPSSLNLNLIEDILSMVKMRLCEDSKQNDSKPGLWEVVKIIMFEISLAEVKIFTHVIDDSCWVLWSMVTILRCKCLFVLRCWLFIYFFFLKILYFFYLKVTECVLYKINPITLKEIC